MLFNKLDSATKRKRSPLLWVVPIVMFITLAFTPVADAASFDQQLTQLKQSNTQTESKKQELGREAAALAGKIADLQNEIADLDSQINKTQDKVGSLNQDISKAEKELAQQRGLLGENIRKMYTENDISTLEMLASSKNFSHFVDQEQHRGTLRDRIDGSAKRIKKLIKQLDSEKKLAKNLLDDQKAMQAHIAERRAENERLLSLNQNEQKAYEERLKANNAKLAELQKQQAAENKKGQVSRPTQANIASNLMRKPAAPGNQYPWANVPFPNTSPDPWGMYKRQCVSYTAWKVASSGRHMPYWGGRGNAKLWDDNARKAGIPVDKNPRVGDVAISNAGKYGHSMYVEAVHSDGTITISQYNAGWDGRYSEVRRSAAGLYFIHF